MDLQLRVPVKWDDGSRGDAFELFHSWLDDESKLSLFTHGKIGDKHFRQFGWGSGEPRRRRLRYVAVLDSDSVSSAHSGARKVAVNETQEVAFELNGKLPCVTLKVSRRFAAAAPGKQTSFRGSESWRFIVKPSIARVASRLVQVPQGARGKDVQQRRQQQRIVSIQVSVPESVEILQTEAQTPAEASETTMPCKEEQIDKTTLRSIATFWRRRAQRRLELVPAYERFRAVTAARQSNDSSSAATATAVTAALPWEQLLPSNPTRDDFVSLVKELQSGLSLAQERLRLAEDMLDRARERERTHATRLALVEAERDGYRKAVEFARNYIETEEEETQRRAGGAITSVRERQDMAFSEQWRPPLRPPPADREARWESTYGENEWLYYDLP